MMTPLRLLPFALFLAACGGESGPSSPPLEMAKGTPSGDAQSGVVGAPLTQPLRVRLLQEGVPVAGQVVIFTAASGAGTLLPGSDTTDGDGVASSVWTLGTSAGGMSVQVTAAGVSGSPLLFTATGLPGAVAQLTAIAGAGQAQEVRAPFPHLLVVGVADGFSNPIPGVTIGWEVTGGSGSVAAATSVSQADGRASIGVTAGGTVGPVTVLASVPGLSTQFGMSVVSEVTQVVVANNFFAPADVTVSAGEAVRWVWNADNHNVAQLDGPATFTASPVREIGATHGPILFQVVGTYHYECSLHEGMLGTITVIAPGPAPSGDR